MNHSFEQEFNSRIYKKLDAVELLRQNLTIEQIEVPGVVVIGAQSAGKLIIKYDKCDSDNHKLW